MNIRYLTIAVLWGGVALLSLAGEAKAQSSCPLAVAERTLYKPYICNVSTPAGGAVQKVTWTVTFSEPVGGVDWRDFFTEDTYDVVTPEITSNPGRRYGLGTVWEEIKKISNTVYEISMEWDCTEAGVNDCSHNEDFVPDWVVGARTDRYIGEVWLALQSNWEFNEMHAPPIATQTQPNHVGMPTSRVSIN